MRPFLLLAAFALAAPAQDPAQAPTWAGTWTLTAPGDIPAAIDRATASLGFITRPIARSRLKKLNPAYQRVVLQQAGGEVRVQFDQRTPMAMPADGRPVAWTREDDETFQVKAQPSGAELVQHYQGQDGARTNRFRLEAAGTLTLSVTVTSGKLPQPLTYTLTYRRH